MVVSNFVGKGGVASILVAGDTAAADVADVAAADMTWLKCLFMLALPSECSSRSSNSLEHGPLVFPGKVAGPLVLP